MKLLEAENLFKTYFIGKIEVKALQGVSLSIEAGEFLAIMGASGSGKSTLMHLLGLLDSPDKGTMKFFGNDITRLNADQSAYLRNKAIGFVFQQFNLLSRSSALENVSLPLLYSSHRADRFEKAKSLLKQVGLEERIQHRPNELSGGQQQRVAIARALVNDPLLILADEPTGNLDSKAGKEVLELFRQLHQNGLTIILVTHDEKIAESAERIIRIHDGKIVEDRRIKTFASSQISPPAVLQQTAEKKYSFKEFQEHLRQAVEMFLSHKLRSFLSLLGVLIGVACVICMLALGQGAREAVTEQLSRLGSNLLSIRPGSAKVRGVSIEAGSVTWFTLDDAKAIKQSISSVKRIAPQVTGQAQLAYGDKNWSTRVTGTTVEYISMRNQQPIAGRLFTDMEDQTRSRVVLLGQTVVRELFGNENPIGKTIKVNRVNFQVIGILPSQGSNSWRDQDDLILMPLMTAMKRVLGKQYIDEISTEITSPSEMPAAQEQIQKLIIRRHQLTPDRYDTFSIRNFTDIQEALSSTTQTFSILLGAVAAISLLVGGIGIMNIMLVSVKERTREIGLRKAIGATPQDILWQFLVESVVITFVGGLLGIILAVGVSWLITTLAEWKTVITLSSIILAFLFSVGVGMTFGLWPAKQAANLDPIHALRYE